MTAYRKHALILFGVTLGTALALGIAGAVLLMRTAALARAYVAPEPTCGCLGLFGMTEVSTPLFVLVLLMSAAMVGAFLRAALKGVALYQRTAAVRFHAAQGVFSHGFLAPQIHFPRSVQQHFTTEERASVLAHERQHVTWRDPLMFFAFDCSGFLFDWLPGFRALRKRFRLLIELDADAAALARTGSRKPLGSALLKSFRFGETATEVLAVSFFGMTEARLRRIVRLPVSLPLAPLAPPFVTIALTVAGFFAVLPHVSAKTVPAQPTASALFQCLAQPHCPRTFERAPHALSMPVFTAHGAPMSVIVLHD